MATKVQHWRVECSINGKVALAIESNSLCGRDLTEEDEEAIRNMANHLLSFVGKGKRKPVEGNSTARSEDATT